MTATADFLSANRSTLEQPTMVDGSRMVLRGLRRLLGAALMLAAAGLWLAPGGAGESEAMLFKLALSTMAVLAGFGFLNASSKPAAPEVEIDRIRREVILVRHNRGRGTEILQRCAFKDLAHVEKTATGLQLWDQHGTFLAALTISDPTAQCALLSALGHSGSAN